MCVKPGSRTCPSPTCRTKRWGGVRAPPDAATREEANRVVVGEIFGRLDAQAAFPVVLQTMASWRPDVVVRDPCEFGALIAAARLGIPQVQVAIGVAGIMRTFADWVDEPLRELEQRAELDQIRGCGEDPEHADVHLGTGNVGRIGRRATGRRRAPVWRYRTPTSAADNALPATWGDAAVPLVYVSFGSVTGSQERFGGMYSGVLAVLADLPSAS